MWLAVNHLDKTPLVACPEYRAASRQYPADAFRGQFHSLGLAKDALKAVLDPDDLHSEFADSRSNDCADNGIKAWRIAAAR
jgi:hypothetical protein